MIAEIRKKYNEQFTAEKYKRFLHDLNSAYNTEITFRVAETPVFISDDFKKELISAGEDIIQFITQPGYKSLTEKSIPPGLSVPGEDEHTTFLAIDFAVCKGDNGNFIPQLIELQGFPSLFFWQPFVARKYREHFYVPRGFSSFFSGFNQMEYYQLMNDVILGDHHPENVILLEIEPEKQNTRIDFYCTHEWLSVAPVCISKLTIEGRKLFYRNADGKKIHVKRIYNRVIFDELLKRNDLRRQFNLTEGVEVEWAGHPNWFFRISKYVMPMLKSKYVPECKLLSSFSSYPSDLENYVLKPLFSFSGSGVVFDVTKEDLEKVEDKNNFMLQRKVKYAEALQSPTGPVKVEIRLLYVWKKNDPKPVLVTNLARLSKGKMIGVKYNKDLDWVGGSSAFSEESV